MVYIIYELKKSDLLSKTNYNEVTQMVLEELDITGVESEHSSMESAISEIRQNPGKLKWKKLTILPILKVNWEGEILTI